MALLDINWKPGDRDLRFFAGLQFVFLAVVAAWGGAPLPYLVGLLCVSGIVALAGFIVPQRIRVIYVVWMTAVLPIGMTIATTAMLILYYGVITPIGLALRATGHDPLQKRPAPQAKTYWIPRKQNPDKRRYFRQF